MHTFSRWAAAGAAVLMLVTTAGGAFAQTQAQDPVKVKSEFIEFDATLFEDGRARPTVTWWVSRKRAKFPPLFAVKKSMRPAMQRTVADRSLK